MPTTIISNMMPYSFGQSTNEAVAKLIGLNTQLIRLGEAIATASSGFTGEEGTEFEVSTTGAPGVPNLFGVQASATPGEQGKSYRFAVDSLNAAWRTFWTTAAPFVEQLDNGVRYM